MAYTNAVFYLDPESGSDAARTALLACVASNPSGTITRIMFVLHGLVTGAVVDLTLFTAWLNAAWKITVVDANNFDLDTAVWQATADALGTVTPRGGSSKADAWKTVNGATSARIAAGDNIRTKASPDPTSLGVTGVWTSAKTAATVSIVSSTNATPIVVTLGAGHGIVTGDTVFGTGHTTNTNANGTWKATVATNAVTLTNADGTNSVGNGVGGASGSIRKLTNAVVELASTVTKNVALCGNRNQKPIWTASANVTCTAFSSGKEGAAALGVDIAAGFTTGKVAYYPLPATLDLSAYQQLSFWILVLGGTPPTTDGELQIKLCSDALGDVPVNTLNIPVVTAAANAYVPLTIDNGSALGTTINSIALYLTTDRGAVNLFYDNIIACLAPSNAASLSLTSLIGKNSAGEYWWPIQSINDKRVMLDGLTGSTLPGSPPRGYSGTTATVTTFKREPFMVAGGTTGSSTNVSGTAVSPITYSGGWDATSMASQTGETWLSNARTNSGVISNSQTFNTFDKINFAHSVNASSAAFSSPGADTTIGSMSFVGCALGHTIAGARLTVTGTLSAVAGVGPNIGTTNAGGHVINSIASVSLIGTQVIVQNGGTISTLSILNGSAQASPGAGLSIGTLTVTDNAVGVSIGSGCVIGTLTASNNTGTGVTIAAVTSTHPATPVILGGSTTGSTTAGLTISATSNGMSAIFRNFTINEATKITAGNFGAYVASRIMLEKQSGVANSHAHHTQGGLIQTQTVTLHGTSPYAWKFGPTDATTRNTNNPLDLPIARVAVAASALVTVSAWVQRDNTGLTLRLKCKGGQLSGVGSVGTDITASSAAAINTWEQLTITFTPTEAGVVELTMEAYGGSAWNGYYSPDLTISQA